MLATADVLPSQTLFCYNLSTRYRTADLRCLLFELFSGYGKVIDVVASRTDPKKRGNAFVVYAEIAGATTALKALQGKHFLGRPLGINYAKTKSDAVAIAEGTYRMRKKRPQAAVAAAPAQPAVPEAKGKMLLPSQVGAMLFVENFPPVMTSEALQILFKQYPGYQETRLIEGRQVAFVDFANELQAEVAMRGLDGFLVTPECALKISVAKK